jgi:hypothetical protein
MKPGHSATAATAEDATGEGHLVPTIHSVTNAYAHFHSCRKCGAQRDCGNMICSGPDRVVQVCWDCTVRGRT